MELSDKDRKMLKWLQKQDAAWPAMRWVIVVASIICLAAFSTGFIDDLALLVVGVMGLSYTLGSWSGRAEVSLLLKLANDRINEQDENT